MTTEANFLLTRTTAIVAEAKSLQEDLPSHIKLIPEIRRTAVLLHQISDVLHHLVRQQQTGGKPHADHD